MIPSNSTAYASPVIPNKFLQNSNMESSNNFDLSVENSKGFTMSFYKSPVAASTKGSPSSNARTPPSLRVKTNRRRDDRINKGVGHGIKKPKTSKAKEKKKNEAKVISGKLKEVKMPPRLATNRNPRLPGEKVKRHVLSSPGISLLDTLETARSPEKKRFFTSRAAAPATVKLTDNIKLSAQNGEIIMKQRGGTFEKKNIGRHIEEALDNAIADHSLSPTDFMSPQDLVKFSAQSTTPHRPKPTRYPNKSPSPAKRLNSPLRKTALTNLARTPTRRSPRKLLMAQNSTCNKSLLNNIKESKEDEAIEESNFPETGLSELVLSPFKDDDSLRLSPVLTLSPCRSRKSTPGKIITSESSFYCSEEDEDASANSSQDELSEFDDTFKEINESEEVVDEILTSLILENGSPKRILNSPRRSPRKNVLKSKSESNSRTSSPLKTISNSNSNSPSVASSGKNVKYFPIFNSEHRLKAKSLHADKENKGFCSPKKFITKSDPTQLTLDAGQKNFGAIHCKTCGLLYEIGDPADETTHTNFHNGFTTALKFPGYKNERQVTYLNVKGGRIVQIQSNDPVYYWKKVNEVLEFVDQDLGFSENRIDVRGLRTAYLYIMDKQVMGCLMSEEISKAYRVIQQTNTKDPKSSKLVCCSNSPEKVCIGISRIWVRATERRKNIATDLVNAMRANAITGHYLTTNDFAFSDPTQMGMIFAEKYCQRSDFMVYRRE